VTVARQAINRCAKVLRKEVAPAFPVRVHQVIMREHEFGDCSLVTKGKPHFLIRLKKDMTPDMVLFVLTHEWAHTLAWTMEHQDFIKDHDAEWGVAYARCWKVVSGTE
jgi:hypothetical protein